MRPARIAAAALVLASGASQAELCYSPAHASTGAPPPSASTVFQCPAAGNGTVAELAARGWRVVRLVSVQVSTGPVAQAAERLLLQRYDRVFRSGFE